MHQMSLIYVMTSWHPWMDTNMNITPFVFYCCQYLLMDRVLGLHNLIKTYYDLPLFCKFILNVESLIITIAMFSLRLFKNYSPWNYVVL